jgi:DNA-binding CsgD family transcriptional regulator
MKTVKLRDCELQMLQHLRNGMTAREMAPLVFLSQRTVETYLQFLKEKFGARSLPMLVGEAIKLGYITA